MLLRLPDTLSRWPIPRRVSPFYNDIAPESAEWFRTFNAWNPQQQKSFDDGKFGLLVALAYPTLDKERFRVACDFMNLFFAVDDITDDLDELAARRVVDVSMDAFLNPTKARPQDESIIGEIARQFWALAIQHMTHSAQARFTRTWDACMTAIAEQARDRDQGRLRTMEEHMELRRLTVGAEPCYAMGRAALNLSEDVTDHPTVLDLQAQITDIIIFDNDIVSYNKEQAADSASHNVITIAMRQYALDLDGALRWVAQEHAKRVDRALLLWPQALALPFPTDVMEELSYYVEILMTWARANHCWNFESGRYFGNRGLTVQAEGMVELRWRSN
ncbi:terpenoid synthase [Earliella scabrosa]|nr:terpenoid synthase [Earliella scabrosa]